MWRSLAVIAGGAFTGAVGWSGNPHLLPAGVLFPAIWAGAPNRWVAALVALAHFLGASRGLPEGVSIFYGSQHVVAIGFWLAASLAFVGVHAALWTARPGWHRALCYLGAALLMAVPPFGIMGWAGPITAAGILFPGWGWFGLAATAILLAVLASGAFRIAVPVLAGLAIWSAASWTAPKRPHDWIGVNTTFQFDGAGQYAGYEQELATIALVRKAVTSSAHFVLLPESALGTWTPTTERLWRSGLAGTGVTVIGGAVAVDRTGYDSVMVEVSETEARVLYRERMPVPVSMWQPWRHLFGESEGAHAYFFANPVVTITGTRVAPLICYEQLLLWPVLQSMLYEPEILIASGNGWWTGQSNIVAIQTASVEAWAALFGVPVVTAFNR